MIFIQISTLHLYIQIEKPQPERIEAFGYTLKSFLITPTRF